MCSECSDWYIVIPYINRSSFERVEWNELERIKRSTDPVAESRVVGAHPCNIWTRPWEHHGARTRVHVWAGEKVAWSHWTIWSHWISSEQSSKKIAKTGSFTTKRSSWIMELLTTKKKRERESDEFHRLKWDSQSHKSSPIRGCLVVKLRGMRLPLRSLQLSSVQESQQ